MANERPHRIAQAWTLLLHDLGANPANVLRRAGIPQDLFVREHATLSTDEFFRFWRGVEEEVGDATLPLRLGSVLSVESFDPVVFAAFCSPDLNTALVRIAQYKRLIAEMLLIVEPTPETTTLRIEWTDKRLVPPPTFLLSKLVYFVQLARMATRHRVVPLHLECPVLPTPRTPYTDYFGTRLTKSSQATVVFSAADAARPFMTANDEIWAFFEPSLKRRLADLNRSATVEERVRSTLLELLPSGRASLDTVAQALGLSPRTLRRRLKDEGTNFQGVLDTTRESLAKYYLKSTSMSGAEISFLLGFEDPNSFFRAFNVWTGTTPERARRALLESG